jgi:hypothetical protein
MGALLKQPFLTMIQADASGPELSTASEILLARISSVVYGLLQRAPQSAVEQAAASGSNAVMMHHVATMMITESPAEDAWAVALLRGSVALAERLEASGGVWAADEAVANLQVSRQTLQQWRTQGRILALPRRDGSFSYPLAQFKPAAADTSAPRPYDAIQQITGIVRSRMSPEELVGWLATEQPMLASAGGAPVTPFAALAAGDTQRVLDALRWLVLPADDGAPTVSEAAEDSTSVATM